MPKASQIGKKDNYISKMRRETGKNDRKKIQRNDSLRPRKIQKQQAHCKIRPRRNDRRSIIHFGRDTAKHEIQKK